MQGMEIQFSEFFLSSFDLLRCVVLELSCEFDEIWRGMVSGEKVEQ
jgi:hypothetical protein